ncbi:MAG: class I fructose-bisphosphate aldolase [Bacteroidetes bacterium]|nr:class I fructose-bisphosphate aldolase [Bacteroidota bacterium]
MLKIDGNILNDLLGNEFEELLNHKCRTVSKDNLYLPSSNFIEKVFQHSNRNVQVLKNISNIFNHGRLAGTGYVSILPVDQGIEHSAGASFSTNPIYFDPENILKLATEGGCNAVATTFGNFGIIARKYAHKIPFIVKINHNESLTYPSTNNQILFGSVKEAWNMGASAIGATIYFGSQNSNRQISEIAEAFEMAHDLGLATILWCYPRNEFFKTEENDHNTAVDITGQSNHIGAAIQADFIKQKLPTYNYGFKELQFSKSHPNILTKLTTEHPIDLCRYQIINSSMGRIGLINSGGPSNGKSDLIDILRVAIINKRAGGMGLICGRKAFQKPMEDGIKILNAIQDIYLMKEITIA